MKSDLDVLMQQHKLDAFLVTGPAMHNAAMHYFTGPVHLGAADIIKVRGQEPLLFYNPMERDEAARTGLKTRNYTDYDFSALVDEAGGDRMKAMALRYQRMFHDLGFEKGRLAVYGRLDAGVSYTVFSALEELMPGLQILGGNDAPTLSLAMATKDDSEIERIRRVGKLTIEVVSKVADYLTSHKAKDGVLVNSDGKPLTIGDVKAKINLWLAERGLDNPEGTIFAIGHDGGVPHSTGNPDDKLELGKPIVFDIFPCEGGGGYFFDFTRTWCLDHAPGEVQALYDHVYAVFTEVNRELKANEPFKKYQDLTCDLYEELNHPTIRQDPRTQVGYVHSLGHGVGLNIHEKPWSGTNADETDKLAPGSVITIEPGLYYPERGMGCRIEDTVAVMADGTMEVLAPYPHDLVLPIKG